MKRLAILLALLPSLASAQAFRVGSGVQIVPRATCSSSVSRVATNGMLCIDSSASNVLKYTNPAGTTITLGSGGGASTLAALYAAGASQTDNTFALDATRLGIRIRDNATPIADNFLLVQNNSGSNNYLAVSATGLSSFKATSAAIDDWLSLSSATTASAGNQKWSPSITLTGNGWKTNATAASQSVSYKLTTVPVQGAANPTGALRISESINGGGATTLLEVGSSNITAYKPVVPGFTTDVVAPSWIAVSGGVGFQNSFVNLGGAYAGTAYWKDATGTVWVYLAAISGTNGTVIFTLPANYRPARQHVWTGFVATGAGYGTVATNGEVLAFGGSSAGVVGLFSFPAEQ